LSSLPGVLIQDGAAALDIHPFMLSLWRKQVRDGVIVAKAAKRDVHTAARPDHAIHRTSISRPRHLLPAGDCSS
jgi:transposase-like protein